ncbi:MAG: hypothetical protein EOO38_14655 [Cytophagaceae bacterium]|nr:MAG: hypothetical protein EOO38_14655 [Cytophagaceae bacterium]
MYFIEGLAHMGLNTGALYQVTGQAPAFTWVKIADFNDAPEAFAVVGNDVYITQFQAFNAFRNLQKEVILKKMFWSSLYPNSVAVFDNNEVCIGLRGGYVRLNTQTKTFRFFQHLPSSTRGKPVGYVGLGPGLRGERPPLERRGERQE